MEQDPVIQKVKAWITPALLALVGSFIMTDIHEMKSDIKKLLELSSADQIRLEHLEDEVDALKLKVYTSSNQPLNDDDYPKPTKELIAILPGKDGIVDQSSTDRKL